MSVIDGDLVSDGNNTFTFAGVLDNAAGAASDAGTLWVEYVGTRTQVFGNIGNDGGVVDAADYIELDFLL